MGPAINILVTGANGQLGKELEQLATAFPSFSFIFLSKEGLPVDDAGKLRSVFDKHQPRYLINCAAYTAVDKAESEKELAFRINAEAVGTLATFCRKNNTRFIHISTDYVFDGTADTPYKEDSAVNPQSVYGASKLEGERLAVKNDPSSIIIRTSWVYSQFGKNFVKTMLRLFKEKEEISVVSDQLGSPTWAADLAEAILQIIASGKWEPGIYHYSNEGVISWYDFAKLIKELSGSICKIDPISTAGYPTPAKRPAYSVLNKEKIETVFGIPLKDWRTSLVICLQRLTANS